MQRTDRRKQPTNLENELVIVSFHEPPIPISPRNIYVESSRHTVKPVGELEVNMYHVLVPIDTSEGRALSQARAVSALHRAGDDVEATLLHVFDNRDRAETTSVTQLEVGNRVVDYLSEQGFSVNEESRYGDPASVIVEAADELSADNIILGGRKRSKLGSLIFGSVSQTVTLEADRPVTITGDTVKADPTYICETCGKKYYTESEITTCNSCGGTKIERVD